MPKMKTKSSAKKRFKVTSKGKVKSGNAFMRHMQMNKSKKTKRHARGMTVLYEADARIVLRNWMPYSRKKKSAAAPKAAEGGR